MVLAWPGDDQLSHGQAQNGVNFYSEVKFDLEDQGQSPPNTIGILTNVFYTYGPNLVIQMKGWWVMAQTSKWLIHTHWHIDRRREWQYPKAKTGLG